MHESLTLIALLVVLCGNASAAPGMPNVLFIMTDQQSADAMSCRMGQRYLNTPAMDSLARQGTCFTRAYASNPLCMPSRNSLFTGRYPHETGVTDNTPSTLDAKEFVSMGTYFRKAGYRTAYFGKWHLCYDEKQVETHGFETLETRHIDAVNAEHAIKFLARQHDKPFLLVTSFMNPHNVCQLARGQSMNNGPIGQPPPTDQLPPIPSNAVPPLNEPDSMTLMRKGYHASPKFPVGEFSPQQWRALRWGYYRLIEKVDAEIGKVLTALRASGLAENTLVVFTSDHGECAGAHGMNQKTVLYEESARVPLIVSFPGETQARTSDRLVNTGIDLLPTLLDFAGLPCPPRLMTGLSLRPLTTGQQVTSWRDQIVVENNMSQAGMVGDFVPMTEGRMVRTERYKYCVYAHGNRRESLIDLVQDPGETIDLATDPAHRQVLLEHRDRLRKFGTEYHDPLVSMLLHDNVAPRPFVHMTEPKK